MARLTIPTDFYPATPGPDLVMGEETSTDPALPGIGIEVLLTGVVMLQPQPISPRAFRPLQLPS